MRDAGKGNNPVAAAAAKDMNPPLPKEWDTCVVFTLPVMEEQPPEEAFVESIIDERGVGHE